MKLTNKKGIDETMTMNKKYLEWLTKEEREKVFHANAKLRILIEEEMLELELSWIEDQLDYFRNALSSYNIGAYQYNFMSVKDPVKFVDGIEEMEKDIPLLIEGDYPTLEKAIELREKFMFTDFYSEEYDDVEINFIEATEDLRGIVIKRMQDQLERCYDEENQLEYFMEFSLKNGIEEELFINANDDDYILYRETLESFA